MSSQDMQFADPEWRPPEEREDNTGFKAQEPPRPINANRLDQPQWQTTSTSQEEGYLGPGYAGSQPQTTWAAPSRLTPRRRSSPWRWIILAFIIIALMSGAFRGFGGYGGPGPQPFRGQTQNFTFNANTVSTVVINGGTGDVTVRTGGVGSTIIVQEITDGGPFGNSGNGIVKPTLSGSTVSVNGDQVSDTSFNITVPTNENLQLKTTDGSIQVDGVNGQMTLQSNNGDITVQNSQGPVSLQTNDGSITLSNDQLTGSSTLNSQNGGITFRGSLESGKYQFQSNDGSIDVTLQNTPNFHLNATTSSGSITTSDFPGIKNTGTQAQGDVGNASTAKQTTLTLTSQSGDITLQASS